jgi:hypothetical protein
MPGANVVGYAVRNALRLIVQLPSAWIERLCQQLVATREQEITTAINGVGLRLE